MDDSHSSDQHPSSQQECIEAPDSPNLPSSLVYTKRKKAKPNAKKIQAFMRRYQTLVGNLRPVIFSPSKFLYFFSYEKLLRLLGLWDFVHVQFEASFRVDSIAQLVLNYDGKGRCSYVDGVRVRVNRADLGRAFGLPLGKFVEGEDGLKDLGLLSKEAVLFVEDLVWNWMLLHDQGWVVPEEVVSCMKVIREGHPEMVDYAGLLWFMVEKELTQGEELVDCYYAPHLQHLLMYQSKEVVLAGESDKVELDGEDSEEVVGVADEEKEVQREEVGLVGEQSEVEVREGSLGVDPMTDVEEEKVDVAVESELGALPGEKVLGDVCEGRLGVDCITYVRKEKVDVAVESELVDLDGEEEKGIVGEGSLGVESMSDAQKEEKDVGVESEMGALAGEEVQGEVCEGDCITDVQKEQNDVGVESELVHVAAEESKGEVGEGSLAVDSTIDVPKEEVYVVAEIELVNIAGEKSKGEVGEGSLEVDSITDLEKEEVDVPERLNVELTLGKDTGTEDIVEEEKDYYAKMMDLEEDNTGAEEEIIEEEKVCDANMILLEEEIIEEEKVCDANMIHLEEEIIEEEKVCDANMIHLEEEIIEEEKVCDANMIHLEEEIIEEEKVCDANMIHLEEDNERVGDDKLAQWQLDSENTVGEHTLQRCNLGDGNVTYSYEGIEEEVEDIEEDEEPEDPFDISENHNTLVGDGLTSDFVQSIQANKLAYSSHEQFHDQADIGLAASRNYMQHTNSTGPSFYNNGSKRVIEHMSENSQNGNGKRLRIDGSWNNESPNFAICMDGVQQVIARARMTYEAKKHSLEQSNMSEQILLSEVQKRDGVIEHLRSKCGEMQEKDEEIYRLDREVQVMSNLLHGYRQALKETQKAFAEYQQQNPLPEESMYKDAGPGGLMLTTEAIERRQLKQKEVYRANCLMLEQKARDAEEGYARQFEVFSEKVCKLDSRLVGLENVMMELKRTSRNHNGSETEQPACSTNDMLDHCEGTENEHPVSKETSTLDDQQGVETN